MRARVLPSVLALAVAGAVSPVFAATTYTVVQISPSSGAFTNPSTNGQSATVSATNAAGDVVGIALVNPLVGSGNISSSGQNVWYYNPITTKSTVIDLSNGQTPAVAGGSYLNANGYAGSTFVAMSNTGYVVGTNPIYFSGSQNGTDTFVYVPATTSSGTGTTMAVPLLNAPDVVAPVGFHYSHVQNVKGVTDAGTVVGTNILYTVGASGGNSLLSAGTDAYVYTVGNSASQLITIASSGDIGYQKADGTGSFSVTAVMNSGYAVGTASAYQTTTDGTFSVGSNAWILNTANGSSAATVIGPSATMTAFGATYTSDGTTEGTRGASVTGVNAAGQVVGTASRYVGGASMGTDVWVYDGTSTSIIGLHDPVYFNGSKISNSASGISSNGIVGGTVSISFAATVNGSAVTTSIGDAWAYRPASGSIPAGTVRVGLSSASYVSSTTNSRSSSISVVGVNGQIAGSSIRYGSTGVYSGQDAWVLDGTSIDPSNMNAGLNATKIVGLNADTGFTAAYYQSGNYRYSVASQVNALGQVAGYSYRYNGGTSASSFTYAGSGVGSQDAFVYDPTSNKDYAIVGSVSSDGIDAYSSISYLSSTGLALGTFMKFSGSTATGYDAFAWSLVNGTPTFVDLGAVTGNVTADGWAALANAIATDAAGDIIGYGVPVGYTGTTNFIGTSQAVFLDVPNAAVPEPASMGMLALGGVALLKRGRRSR